MAKYGLFSRAVFTGQGVPYPNAPFGVYELDQTTQVPVFFDSSGTTPIIGLQSSSIGNLTFYARTGPAYIRTGSNPFVAIPISAEPPSIRSTAVNTTAAFNEFIGVDASGGNRTVTLLPPVANQSSVYVKKTDSSTNTVTLLGVIDGVNNFVLVSPTDAITVVPNATATGYWTY